MRVLLFPRTPETGVVGHSSLSERHGKHNGLGTAQERIRLDGDAPSAFPGSTTLGTEPEPRSIAQPIAYRGEAEEAVGL